MNLNPIFKLKRLKPINKVLVSIPAAFTEEIVTDSGFKLWKDPSFSKEWNATTVATVSALSDFLTPESKAISDTLDVGMDVIVDYKIVADFDFASDAAYFELVTPEETRELRKYTNSLGQWINVRAIPGTFGNVWVGWLQDKKMEQLDGVQGTEKDVERWLGQFSFGKTDSYTFKNQITIDKKEYWKVPYDQILAKKVQGAWEAVGDRILMMPIDIDITQQVSLSMGGIKLPESSLQKRFFDRAMVVSGGEDMGLKRGDIVGFNTRYIEKYEIDGLQYFIIRKRRVDGLWN